MSDRDAILVLGGGVRENGQLPPWGRARFDRALELHRGEPVVCLSAGTIHRPPPLDEEGFPIFEASAGAGYLMSRALPKELIRVETLSYDTIGNAYFAKLLHVEPPAWRRLLVVTSMFHMARTQAIFDWVFGMDAGRYSIEYSASPDEGLDPESLEARGSKEATALRKFQQVRAEIRDKGALHHWLFTRHDIYSADGHLRRQRASDPFVLQSD